MPELLRMPGIAAGDEEVVLSGWPVAPGAAFAAGEVIATVETSKANVDVEAPWAGVILKLLVAEGTSVRVGDPIAVLGAEGERVSDVDSEVDGAAAEPERNGRVFASPLARKLAREAGIPFEALTGSGPNGRIVRADVEAAIARRAATEPEVEAEAQAEPEAGPEVEAGPEPEAAVEAGPEPEAAVEVRVETAVPAADGLVPHSRIRTAIARRLTASKTTVPHFYVRGSARVDALLALRADVNAGGSTGKVSVNDLIVKAVAAAHVAVPAVNVVWTDDGMRTFDTVDVGVAVATEGGLVTPVARGVNRMPLGRLAATTKDFADRARRGALRQNELDGGSVTVTNLGMFGTEEFTAIINPPQSMILAVGAARREPVVTADGDLAAATVLHVTLSVDHRAVDGALAAQWMRAFLDLLEHPLRILI